jgi:hypothetical protein
MSSCSDSDTDGYYTLPQHRPLRASDFTHVAPGTVVRMWYNSTNEGSFDFELDCIVPEHESGQTPRLRGRFRYDDCRDGEWSDVGDYLYTFHKAICRGSGAEPCWARPDPPRSKVGWCHSY